MQAAGALTGVRGHPRFLRRLSASARNESAVEMQAPCRRPRRCRHCRPLHPLGVFRWWWSRCCSRRAAGPAVAAIAARCTRWGCSGGGGRGAAPAVPPGRPPAGATRRVRRRWHRGCFKVFQRAVGGQGGHPPAQLGEFGDGGTGVVSRYSSGPSAVRAAVGQIFGAYGAGLRLDQLRARLGELSPRWSAWARSSVPTGQDCAWISCVPAWVNYPRGGQRGPDFPTPPLTPYGTVGRRPARVPSGRLLRWSPLSHAALDPLRHRWTPACQGTLWKIAPLVPAFPRISAGMFLAAVTLLVDWLRPIPQRAPAGGRISAGMFLAAVTLLVDWLRPIPQRAPAGGRISAGTGRALTLRHGG